MADEHLASEITLRVLALQRVARQAKRRRRSQRVLLLAPEGERHVIGLNMACDLLLAAGYDTLMLGADVPLAGHRAGGGPPPGRRRRHHRDDGRQRRGPRRRDRPSARRRSAPRDPARRQGVPFEVAATWSAAVCPDVSTVVETADALVHHAPLN